jgi:tetratricopeptide (TPR) repeat protein
MYEMNGDPKHAMDLLFLVTKTSPQYAPAWESTARLAIDTQDWSTAQKAIDILDTSKDLHLTATFLRASLLAKSGKKEEAIQPYKEVIDSDPTSEPATDSLQALHSIYKDLGRLNEATDYIKSLRILSPAANTILGECYLDLGKTDLAAAAFDAAIAGNALDPTPYLLRAKIFLDAQKPEQAVDILKKAFIQNPKDMRAAFMEAQILGSMGRHEETIAIYDDILSRNPGLDVAANNMAEIIADYEYTDKEKLEKARQIAERFEASSDPLLLDTLAWVYYRQGNLAQAQTLMERVIGAKANLPAEIHYHNGAILLKAGHTKEGKAELEKALSDHSSYPGRDDAEKLLASGQ